MEIRRIRLDEIEPDKDNVRKAFNGIDELAKTFASNSSRPGEPFNPLIVAKVSDGEKPYRIVDGERRFMAMQSIGTEECDCLVDESVGALDAIAIMLATDHKSTLTMDESARGIQTAMYLGMDAENVVAMSKDKRLNAETIRRASKAIKAASKATQLSMTQLFKLADVDDDGQREELVRLYEQDGGDEWDSALEHAVRKQSIEKQYALIVKRLEDAGIEFVTEEPGEGYVFKTKIYGFNYLDEYQLKEKCRDRVVYVKPSDQYSSVWSMEPEIWSDAKSDPEEEARRLRNEYREMLRSVELEFEQAQGERIGFVAENLRLVAAGMNELNEFAALQSDFRETVMEFAEDNCDEQLKDALVIELTPMLVALFWSQYEDYSWDNMCHLVTKKRLGRSFADSDLLDFEMLGKYVEMVNALVAVGYEPSESELGLRETASLIRADARGGDDDDQ